MTQGLIKASAILVIYSLLQNFYITYGNAILPALHFYNSLSLYISVLSSSSSC